ncbi:MAG: DHHW family protein [Oscillospiraceae bacterium]|nr:DHHW family protein [Oscillospiraceae bacterium]
MNFTHNLHKKVLVLLFSALVLAGTGLTFATLPEHRGERMPFSPNENRYFLPFLAPDFGGYFSGFFSRRPNNIRSKQFMDRFDTFVADRFFLREELIILQNGLELLRGKTQINDVYNIGDRLVLAWERQSQQEQFALSLSAIDTFAGFMHENHEARSFIMLIPTAYEVYRDSLPANAPANAPPDSSGGFNHSDQLAFIAGVYEGLEHLRSVDAATLLHKHRSDYIFYRTDHHQTAFGAYLSYTALSARLGFEPLNLASFNIEHASSSFRGTLFSRTLNSRITPDLISLYTPKINAPELLLYFMGEDVTEQRGDLFWREYLYADENHNDKYMVFMGGNYPIVQIDTDANNDRAILIFKDSYANAILPLLANHYSRITVADMRYIRGGIDEFIGLSEYEQVLFLYSVPNFEEAIIAKELTELGNLADLKFM